MQADATSLADLKAEMVRKKNEAIQNRQKGNFRPEANLEKKKTNIWSKENTGLLARMQRDMEQNEEEERTWARSKSILERKTRIYNSLQAGKGKSEIADNFLVEFGRKGGGRRSRSRSSSSSDSEDDRRGSSSKDYPARDRTEEWVEYTDALGRTRTCMRKDLKKLKAKDKDIVRSDSEEEQETGAGARREEPDLLSEDMRRDLLRQKWEKEEMENLTKDSLHYSDVRFDEARAHGAGFYAFSKDDQKRTQEQATLKKLHEETDEARREKEKKAAKRKKEMAERIRRIKQKRREKLGLPPLEEDAGTADKEEGSDSEEDADITKSVAEGLKKFRQDHEEAERRRNEIRRRENLREWDLEKEDLGEMKKEWKVLTQQEWLDRQRLQRNTEFAPPSAYNEARVLLQQKEEAFIKSQEAKRKLPKPAGAGPRVGLLPTRSAATAAPAALTPLQATESPASASQVTPPTSLKEVQELAQKGWFIDNQPSFPFPDQLAAKPVAKPPLDPMALLDCKAKEPERVLESYSTAVRLELHRRMQEHDYLPPGPGLNTRIINELEQGEDSEEEDDRDMAEAAERRGVRTEVAPPCDMNYYNNTAGPRNTQVGYRSHEDMATAFNAGLQARKRK